MNYQTRKAFLEKAVVEIVYKFDEKSYLEIKKKVSRSLKYNIYIFLVHKHVYIYIHTYICIRI